MRTLAPVILLIAAAASAELIDRIAVSVGNQVITTSDIDRQIRVSAFLGGVKPDLSVANRRAMAGAMVEQKLIRRELETARYPLPSEAEIVPLLAEFQKKYFKTEDEYRRALAEAGITDQEVRDELLWQRTLLRFVEVRFRPAVQVMDEEIQKYFETVVEPAARAAHPGEPVLLEDYRSEIQQSMIGKRQDEELDRWLKEARNRTDIVYHEEAFQ